MNTLEVLQEQIETSRTEEMSLEGQRSLELIAIIDANFGHIVEDDMEIKGHTSTFTFSREHEDYTYKRDLCELRLQESYWDKELPHFKSLRVSCYSTSSESDWELKRLIVIGKVAEVVLEKQQDILDQLNNVWDKYKEQISTARTKRYEVEKSISTLQKAEEDAKVSRLLRSFYKGEEITFQDMKGTDLEKGKLYLPGLTMGWDRSSSNVRSIKAVKLSSSLKTCDLQITNQFVSTSYPRITDEEGYEYNDYNNPIFEVETRSHISDRVKVSYIEKFLRSNSDRVKQNTVAS